MLLRFFQQPPLMVWPGLALMALMLCATIYQYSQFRRIMKATEGQGPLDWEEVTPVCVCCVSTLCLGMAAFDLTCLVGNKARPLYANPPMAVIVVAACVGLLLLAAYILARHGYVTQAWITGTLSMYGLAVGSEYGRLTAIWAPYNWNYWISGAIVLAAVGLIGTICSWLSNALRPWRRRRNQMHSVPSA